MIHIALQLLIKFVLHFVIWYDMMWRLQQALRI